MPLFGASKRTVPASEYARWFHTWDSATDPLLASFGPAAFAGALRDEVAKIDPRFGATDLDLLTREVNAMRSEIFGVAWGHAFLGKDKHLIAEGVIAHEILTSQGLWELGAKYNKAVARSVDALLPTGERTRAAAAMFQNTFRLELAKKWMKGTVPPEAIGRVINRSFSEEPWNKGETMRHLLFPLLRELGIVDLEREDPDPGLNQNALVAIQVALRDIYDGSRENFARYNIKAD